MIKFVSVLFAALFFAGCVQPVVQVPDGPQHYAIVKNSLWKTVRKVALDPVARSAQNPTYAEIQAQIATYNALSLTDQEWIYLDEAPDIANAPNGNIFYVRRDNGLPVASFLNLTRQYIVDNYWAYLEDAEDHFGGDLVYVDHIPPAPILAKDTTPYEWYSLYVIEDEPTPGVKLYEDHGGYFPDESFHGQWILLPYGETMPDGTPGGGWPSIDNYYDQMLGIYSGAVSFRPYETWPGVTKAHVVTRQLYPPFPPVVIE